MLIYVFHLLLFVCFLFFDTKFLLSVSWWQHIVVSCFLIESISLYYFSAELRPFIFVFKMTIEKTRYFLKIS